MNAAENYLAKVREQSFALALPSGNTIKVILPPLHTWVAMGLVPPFFLKVVNQMWGGASDQEMVALGLSEDDQVAVIKSFLDLICAACVEPRVVESNPQEGELDIAKMPTADRDFIAAWVLAGGPGLGVPTQTGEVQPERLVKFPDRETGGATAEIGGDGEDVRRAAERPA